jgi:hypothetical protein
MHTKESALLAFAKRGQLTRPTHHQQPSDPECEAPALYIPHILELFVPDLMDRLRPGDLNPGLVYHRPEVRG